MNSSTFAAARTVHRDAFLIKADGNHVYYCKNSDTYIKFGAPGGIWSAHRELALLHAASGVSGAYIVETRAGDALVTPSIGKITAESGDTFNYHTATQVLTRLHGRTDLHPTLQARTVTRTGAGTEAYDAVKAFIKENYDLVRTLENEPLVPIHPNLMCGSSVRKGGEEVSADYTLFDWESAILDPAELDYATWVHHTYSTGHNHPHSPRCVQKTLQPLTHASTSNSSPQLQKAPATGE